MKKDQKHSMDHSASGFSGDALHSIQQQMKTRPQHTPLVGNTVVMEPSTSELHERVVEEDVITQFPRLANSTRPQHTPLVGNRVVMQPSTSESPKCVADEDDIARFTKLANTKPSSFPGRIEEFKAHSVTFSTVLIEWKVTRCRGSQISSYLFTIEEQVAADHEYMSTNHMFPPILDSYKRPPILDSYKLPPILDSYKTVYTTKMTNGSTCNERTTRSTNVSVNITDLNYCSFKDSPKIQHLLENLKHSTSYKIYIQAVNNYGRGLASHPIEVETCKLPSKQINDMEKKNWIQKLFRSKPKLPHWNDLSYQLCFSGSEFGLLHSQDIMTRNSRACTEDDYISAILHNALKFRHIYKPYAGGLLWNLHQIYTTDLICNLHGFSKVLGIITNQKETPFDRAMKIAQARVYCEQEIMKFELQASTYILEQGLLKGNMFTMNERSEEYVIKIKTDLERGSSDSLFGVLWERVLRLIELITAIMNKNYTDIAKVYYKLQNFHTLYENAKPVKMPVYIMKKLVSEAWIEHISNAIDCINTAAPGLHLFETYKRKDAKILIGYDHEHSIRVDTPSTKPINSSLSGGKKFFIHLPPNYPTEDTMKGLGKDKNTLMKGSAIHEMLHALNFDHHYQRFDAELYLDINRDLKANQENNLNKVGTILNLTRHDLFSILHCNEIQGKFERKGGDPFSTQKSDNKRSSELSELDKVALNLKYMPCKSERYNPKVQKELGIPYCGREVMANHNQVAKKSTDNRCGPNNWANCPACRVIRNFVHDDYSLEELPVVRRCISKGRWQGLSGLFYCGKTFSCKFPDSTNTTRDRVCGPDNGMPCEDCGKIMYPKYKLKDYIRFKGDTQTNTRINQESSICTVS